MRRHEQRHRWDDDGDTRVRVLVECAPADSPSIIASTIEREGYDVRTCGGPGDVDCDLDRHGACDLIDGADVVVNLLGRDDGLALAMRVAAGRRPPGVVAEVRVPHGLPLDGALDGLEPAGTVVTVRAPATRRALLAAIQTALAGPSEAAS